jgi:hypothetical protein
MGPSHKADASLRLHAPSLSLAPQRKRGRKKGKTKCPISVTIVGFVGAEPEQRQARNNGSKFTVLSVATQRSWKNAEDEWVSKVEWHRVAYGIKASCKPRKVSLDHKRNMHLKGQYQLYRQRQSGVEIKSCSIQSPNKCLAIASAMSLTGESSSFAKTIMTTCWSG